jgi:hypothetical protein
MSTIYGRSNHPVFVKKINLNTWCLRFEVEALVAEKLKALGKTSSDELTDEEVAQIKDFYLAREKQAPNNVLQFVRNEEKTEGAIDPELANAVAEMTQSEGEPAAVNDETKSNEEQKVESAEAKSDDTVDISGGTEGNEEPDDSFEEMKKAMEEMGGANPPKSSNSNILPNFSKENTPFRRKPALLDESHVSPGVMILSDINMEEILFFSKHQFNYGQSIVIEFLVPNYFILSAEVITCNKYNRKSRIINPTRPEYRLRARFTFQTMGERTLLRNFLNSIAPEIPSGKTKKSSNSEKKDDLSDLGL